MSFYIVFYNNTELTLCSKKIICFLKYDLLQLQDTQKQRVTFLEFTTFHRGFSKTITELEKWKHWRCTPQYEWLQNNTLKLLHTFIYSQKPYLSLLSQSAEIHRGRCFLPTSQNCQWFSLGRSWRWYQTPMCAQCVQLQIKTKQQYRSIGITLKKKGFL